MALRGGEYLVARRIADRGNDGSVFNSRARGKDQHSTCRVADRGSSGIGPDPRDLKIKRLRQRVRDLETQQEIKRLRQRVRDLELQRVMRAKETESGLIVRDIVNEEEEHPSSHPHPWFLEPISKDEDEPSYDDDGIIPDAEECLRIQKFLGWITSQGDERVEEDNSTPQSSVVSSGSSRSSESESSIDRGSNEKIVVVVEDSSSDGGIQLDDGVSRSGIKEIPTKLVGFLLCSRDFLRSVSQQFELNWGARNKNNMLILIPYGTWILFDLEYPKNMGFQNLGIFIQFGLHFNFSGIFTNVVLLFEFLGYLLNFGFQNMNTLVKDLLIAKWQLHNTWKILWRGKEFATACVNVFHIPVLNSHCIQGKENSSLKLDAKWEGDLPYFEYICVRVQVQWRVSHFLHKDQVNPCSVVLAKRDVCSKISVDLFDVFKTRGRVFFEGGERENDVGGPGNPLDPGPAGPSGVRLKSTRANREGKLEERVVTVLVMTVWNKRRKNVPFDPGGFDLKLKLEDEFF